MRIFTSCGSEGSGDDSPAVRNVVEVVRKRVFHPPDFNHLPAWDLRRVRATRRTVIDCAAASPLAVSSVSTTGLAAGKDRHFDLHTPPALRGDRKSRAPLH